MGEEKHVCNKAIVKNAVFLGKQDKIRTCLILSSFKWPAYGFENTVALLNQI